MAQKPDHLGAAFITCSGAALALSAYNRGYIHKRDFAAEILDYEGEVSCKEARADERQTNLTHVVVREAHRNRIAIPLERL